MKWCLVHHSDFYNVVVGFKNWYENEEQFGYARQDMQELALCGSHLVLETERILGYMQFVQGSLLEKVPGYSFYQNRANYCIQRITDEVNTIAAEITKLSQVTLSDEQLKAYIDLLRRRLFNIVVTLESFEVVTSAAGMSSSFEEEIFGPLKRYIYAEWAQDRPELKSSDENPLDEFMTTMASEM
jgi:hypothetical protein